MKKTTILTAFIAVLTTLTSITTYAQSTGTITGMVTDKEFNNEPLPQANVLIKGTQKGTVTDFDGLYTISNVEAGSYTLEFSFVGYETKALPVTVVAGETAKINIALAGSAVAMDEVVIKAAPTKRESETALLVQQKKAVEIKESIGAQQLAKLGVSNAAAATTKISGVTKSEGSGDVFVRGLGDRYLYTTLNGLPIPSDDVEKKNINLGLFSTGLISSVDISKTTSAAISADQSSGNIDIKTKEMTGSDYLAISVGSGTNTNIFKDDTFNNFKVSPNTEDIHLGFYNKRISTDKAITEQTWAPGTDQTPINTSLSVNYGKKVSDKVKLLFSLGQSSDYRYTNGIFRNFTNNILVDSISDAINWSKAVSTTGLLDLNYRINDNHKVKSSTLLINNTSDNVFEGGRAGDAIFLDATSTNSGLFQFRRDQNTRTSLLLVQQLHSSHTINEKHKIDFSIGYNILNANEPNRIRNEADFNINTGETRFPVIGGPFQQRKSLQLINDNEINAKINDKLTIIEDDSENSDRQSFVINLGANFRNKTRDFQSKFYGAGKNLKRPRIYFESIDDIYKIFTLENFLNEELEKIVQPTDTYNGVLQSVAVYTDFNLKLGKLYTQLGLRFQQDVINVDYDVINISKKGSLEKKYANLYPSINLKYKINEKNSIRFSNSTTITLPEFKEVAPFGYTPPVGQEVSGNINLEPSKNINYDLKWEFFPSKSQIVSVTSFYKQINNPINKILERSALSRLSFFNSGKKAEILGLEGEFRLELIKQDTEALDPQSSLKLITNASRMWHKQDLIERYDDNGKLLYTYRYNGYDSVGLQGASDWIGNASLNYSNNKENPFEATITANYSSDKIYALGAPKNQSKPAVAFDNAIVEKGFVALDLIIQKQINERLKLKLSGKNLLNPEISRTQLINRTPANKAFEKERKVFSYKAGAQISLSLNYKI